MPKLSPEEFQILAQVKDFLQTMSGRNGTVIYGGTTEYTGLDFESISIREAGTAFTSLVCTGSGSALGFSDFVKGGATTLVGDLLVAPPGYRFTSFKLSSGSIQCT